MIKYIVLFRGQDYDKSKYIVRTQVTVEKLAMAICGAVDGPCVCSLRDQPIPDREFAGCARAMAAAQNAWPYIEMVNQGFHSLGERPDAARR